MGGFKICDMRAFAGAAFGKWETKVALSDHSESPLSVMEDRESYFKRAGIRSLCIVVCCARLVYALKACQLLIKLCKYSLKSFNHGAAVP